MLSEQKSDKYEQGFITAELIEKYAGREVSVFMCGPQAMYDFADKQLKKLGLSGKFVHKESNCTGVRDVEPKEYPLTVHIRDEVFNVKASASETLLTAMERAGLNVPAKCRAGGCGYCHSRLISGKYTIAGDDKRRLADKKFSFIHPCCTYPDSAIELEVPEGEAEE